MGIIKNILDPGGFIFREEPPDVPPVPPIPTFGGLTTPSFALQASGGGNALTRRTPAPNFSNIFNQLGANQTNFLGQIPRLRGLGAETTGLQGQLAGIRGGFGGLQSQIAGTLPGLRGLQGQVGDIGQRFSGMGSELAGIQGEIRPGFGRLTEAQVAQLRNREAASASNLRDTLAQRGLGGSSLALQEGRRQELDFAQEEALIRGDAFERELAATRDFASLRAQVLAGEVGTAQEQRALIAETRTTINNIGSIMQLDQENLAQQAELLGIQFGLSQAESTAFSNQLANIQVQMQATQQQISNELNELGISGNIVNEVASVAAQVGIAQAKLTAEAAAGVGFAAAQERGQRLGLLGSIGGAAIGGLFTGGAGAGAGAAAGGAVGRQVATNTTGGFGG